MIEAQHLVKRFRDKKRGEVCAVDHVSFRCRPGEIYGLLGANGAGKTTTLRMLATILQPSEGTAIVAGYDVTKEPQKVRSLRRISFHGHRPLWAPFGARDGRILRPVARAR